jgi:transcriptional regulator with XRE-family HTH domain
VTNPSKPQPVRAKVSRAKKAAPRKKTARIAPDKGKTVAPNKVNAKRKFRLVSKPSNAATASDVNKSKKRKTEGTDMQIENPRPDVTYNSPKTRGRPRSKPRTVDREWLEERMAARRITAQQVAGELGKSGAIVTRIMQGARTVQADDVLAFARLLDAPADEILRRLGYEIEPHQLTITGCVREDGRVSTITQRAGEAVPITPPGGASRALVIEVTEGAALPYAGAIVVYSEAPASAPVPLNAVGRLCIVEAAGQEVPLFGTLIAGKGDKASLVPFPSGDPIPLKKILRAGIVTDLKLG